MLTASEAARELGRDPRTVRRWIRERRIAGQVLGRRYYTSSAAVAALLRGFNAAALAS